MSLTSVPTAQQELTATSFRMPTTAPCPLTSYLHGGLLEEGCIHVSKMRLEKEVERRAPVDEDSSDAESVEDDDTADHPGLRMQWDWTELKKDAMK